MNNFIIETLATGDEVVNGDVADTNSAYVSQQLAHQGHLMTRHTALPDDKALLDAGIREISQRANVCICSGGMGPTEDDLTSEVVAAVLGVGLEVDETALARMQALFDKAGLPFPQNNLRSATVPATCEVLQNDVGTAPAFRVKIANCWFFFLPGVPREFHFFVDHHILPWFQHHEHPTTGAVVQLKTLGWPESVLAEKLADLSPMFPGVKIGYRAVSPEVWVKLTIAGVNREAALKQLAPAVALVQRRLGDSIFSQGDQELPQIVHRLLLEHGQLLATAEGYTGGLLAYLLGSQGFIPYYQGGIVTGQGERDAETLARDTAQQLDVGLTLAIGEVEILETQAERALGKIRIALFNQPEDTLQIKEVIVRGTHEHRQRMAAFYALDLLRRYMLKVPID